MYLKHLLPGWSGARKMLFVTKSGETIESVMEVSQCAKKDHKQP